MEPDKAPTSERSLKSRAILARQVNGIVADQVWKKIPSSGQIGAVSSLKQRDI